MRIRERLTGLFIIVLAASALLLAACGDAGRQAVAKKRGPAPSATPSARQLSPLPTRPLSPDLAVRLERARVAASAGRELGWKDEARMIELTGWEYGTRSREMAELLGGDDLRALSRLAVAGGILPEGTDLAMLAASFTAASAGAAYSPLDKSVLLLADPQNRHAGHDALLTHELVHALQDQHFDLLGLLLVRPYNFDRTEALFSVIEGDAMNVQRRLEQGAAWERRPLEEVARQEDGRFDQYRRDIGALFPPLLSETFIFRYRDGVRFVEAVRRKGGARGVDELLRRPPVSTEQILHPEKYFVGEAPREVAVDEQGFASQGWTDLVASTPLGEIGARGLLLKAVSVKDAARAAAGWGGDRAYLFAGVGRGPLFVWKTAWERPEDAAEFFRAYQALRPRGGTTAAGDDSQQGQSSWREADGSVALVRQDGDQVIVIRGAGGDVQSALALALR